MERRNRRNLLLVLLFVGILPILTSCALFISSDGRLRLYRVYYAKEVVAEVYVVPGILSISPLPATHVTYEQTVYRATNKNFFLRATLSGGAKFSSTGAEPVLAYADNAGGDDPTVSPLVGSLCPAKLRRVAGDRYHRVYRGWRWRPKVDHRFNRRCNQRRSDSPKRGSR